MNADIEKIAAIVERFSAQELFSGAILVERAGGELFSAAKGLAHRGFLVPNTVETRFDTASVTKLFTAAAAFRLIDRGLIALDERIGDIIDLSGTKIPANVTLRHCLTHSSGIADDADEEAGEDYEAIWRERPCYLVRETRDFLPQFAHKEPLFPAGDHVRYNNCAFILAGLSLEARSGLPYRELVAREVFGPAGMGRSLFASRDEADLPDIAEGYATVEGPEGKPLGFRKNIYAFPPVGSPDSGAYTTVRDLGRFFGVVEGPDFLGEAVRAEFLKAVMKAADLKGGGERRQGYAFEHDYGPDGRLVRYGKDGVNPGVAAIAMRYPRSRGFVAILSNQDCDVWSLCREIASAAHLAVNR
jgi:CubicO group peptidase (beta-lactamase class C family)